MVTRMWVFPGGEVVGLSTLDADIERLKQTVSAVILDQPQQPVPVQGMVDQLYDYEVELHTSRTLVRITGRQNARTRSGRPPRPGTQTVALPDEAVSLPIMSGKYDGKSYMFALIEVSET